MTFTFVHTADWQIGRPFRRFGERIGALLEDARLDVIDSIAAVARAAGARHVLVAGDVFDDERLERRIVWPAIDRMARAEGIVWHLLPGNHDPARPGGLWSRIVGYGLPANVRPELDAVAVDLGDGVALLSAPLKAKGSSADPTAWMDSAATPPGTLRIGLAHGSVRDFSQSGTIGVIDPGRAGKANLAYLALGDWHGCRQINPATWYAGTPEPDRFGDESTGHVLVVRMANSQAPQVERVRTGHYVWVEDTATLATAAELDTLATRLIARAPSPDRLIVRLALTGALTPVDHAAVEAWRERLEARVRHLELETRGLTVRAGGDALSELLHDPRLVTVAERLAAMAGDPANADRQTADRALLRLHALAHAAAAESP